LGGILFAILSAGGMLATIFFVAMSLRIGSLNAREGVLTFIGGFLCSGVLLPGVSLSFFWYAILPENLSVDEQALYLVRRGKIIGEVPFENIRSIRLLRVQRHSVHPITFAIHKLAPQTAIVVVGLEIELMERDHRDTYWPGYSPDSRDLQIRGQWERPTEWVVDELRDALDDYLDDRAGGRRDRRD
jgi:hypothetical protein